MKTMALADMQDRSHLLSSPLIAWHLLSLDAPTVATVWTLFIARTAHVSLPLFAPCAMFLAVWIIYATDRLLDSRSQHNLEARHRFHARHRRAFRIAILIAALALIPIIVAMPRFTLELYLGLAAVFLLWFAIIHRLSLPIPKELAVGFFFSAAVFIPTISRNPALLRPSIVPAILFANLCSLNCLFIYAWERPRQRPHRTTRFGLRSLQPIAIVSIALPLLLLASNPTPIYLAASLAAALLLTLHRIHTRALTRPDRTTLRALADLALLTPLLLFPWVR